MEIDLQESIDDLVAIVSKLDDCVQQGRFLAPRCADVAAVCDAADHWLTQASRILSDLQYEVGHSSLPRRWPKFPSQRRA